jgi:hypothetical protein
MGIPSVWPETADDARPKLFCQNGFGTRDQAWLSSGRARYGETGVDATAGCVMITAVAILVQPALLAADWPPDV